MPDGTVVAAQAFFSGSDLDLSTAAGASSQNAGGGTSYADDAGSLIGGVDRQGTQGTDYWGESRSVPETPVVTGLARADEDAASAPLPVRDMGSLRITVYEGGIDGVGSRLIRHEDGTRSDISHGDFSNNAGPGGTWASLGLPAGAVVDEAFLLGRGAEVQDGVYALRVPHGVLYVNAADGTYLFKLT